MSRKLRFPPLHLGNGFFWLKYFKNSGLGAKPLCTHSNNTKKELEAMGGRGMTREEAYNQLQNMDFMVAARILFTAPPPPKKFGLDFHLVQLFFVCLPSLAVYLVAQYARSDMRKMDAELQLKRKQAEEEEKAKEAEKSNKENQSISELVNVKNRLDALEGVVKEIADETKKISQVNLNKGPKAVRKEPTTTAATDAGIKEPVAAAAGGSKQPVVDENSVSQNKPHPGQIGHGPEKE